MKRVRSIAVLFVGLALAAMAWGAGSAPEETGLATGDHRRSIEHQGRQRTYLLHLPDSAAQKQGSPVVLAFHGGGTNARLMKFYVDLDRVADKEGFIVVYPNGTGRLRRVLTWNAGDCCGYAAEKKVDDVDLVRAILDDLEQVLSIDRRRIYATGLSNGAMMAYRLACELSQTIAAVAPVAGTMNLKSCRPVRPVPILHFHGTADLNCPYEGGVGPRSIAGLDFPSVEATLTRWREINGCEKGGSLTAVPDRQDDGTAVEVTDWNDCRSGAPISLVKINGGGHSWPGVRAPLGGRLGPATQDISASEMIWKFFRDHPLPEKAPTENPL